MAQVPVTNDSSGLVTILLDGNAANVSVGGTGKSEGNLQISIPPAPGLDGALRVLDKYGNKTIALNGQAGEVMFGADAADDAPIHFDTERANLRVGGGKALSKSTGGAIEAQQPTAGLISPGISGVISLQDSSKQQVIHLAADGATIQAGANGQDGDISLFAKETKSDSGSNHLDASKAAIHLAGGVARIRAGGNGQAGNLLLFPKASSSADFAKSSNATIQMDGEKGNITLAGDVLLTAGAADCAEEFSISEDHVEPGTVMVIAEDGALQTSRQPYDRCVAGVIAGAGDYHSGIVLDRQSDRADRQPLALIGKVYCKADARYGPIEIGDLLTTSATAGHAMKALDPHRSFGAVIGKALQPLREGQRLITILVALQ